MCLSWQSWNGFHLFIKSLGKPSLAGTLQAPPWPPRELRGEPMPPESLRGCPSSPCRRSSVTSPGCVFVFILCILRRTVNPVFRLLRVFSIITEFLMFLYPFIFPGHTSDVPVRQPRKSHICCVSSAPAQAPGFCSLSGPFVAQESLLPILAAEHDLHLWTFPSCWLLSLVSSVPITFYCLVSPASPASISWTPVSGVISTLFLWVPGFVLTRNCHPLHDVTCIASTLVFILHSCSV